MSDELDSGYSEEEINLIEAILFAAPKPVAHAELKKIIKSPMIHLLALQIIAHLKKPL